MTRTAGANNQFLRLRYAAFTVSYPPSGIVAGNLGSGMARLHPGRHTPRTPRRPGSIFCRGTHLTEQEPGYGQQGDQGHAAYRPEQSATNPVPGFGYPPPPPQAPPPQAPPPQARPQQARPQQARPQQPRADTRGFLGALFDFGFTSFVTPKVVKVLYPLIMVLTGLTALAFVAGAFHASTGLGFLTLLVLAPLFFLVVTAIYRILLEFFIVIFRVAEDIRALRERGDIR